MSARTQVISIDEISLNLAHPSLFTQMQFFFVRECYTGKCISS